MIDIYTPELVNKLELQSRQPSIFFAAVIIDDEKAYEIMKLLMEAGANPHFKDQSLQTVLFYVCREGIGWFMQERLDVLSCWWMLECLLMMQIFMGKHLFTILQETIG